MPTVKFKHNGRSYTREVRFDESDVFGMEACGQENVRPWFLHERGECLAVVFAADKTYALHVAADEGRLDRFLVDFSDNTPLALWRAYGPRGATTHEAFKSDRLSLLGEFGFPFDVSRVRFQVLPPHCVSAVSEPIQHHPTVARHARSAGRVAWSILG